MQTKTVAFGLLAIVVVAALVLMTNKPTTLAPIQSHRSYSIKSATPTKVYAAGQPAQYSFSIIDEQGGTLKDFALTHTKLMHLIVVRKDLAYFQHLHPELNSETGQFTLTNLIFPADGEYRIFADFASANGMKDEMGTPLGVTVSEDAEVGIGKAYKSEALGGEEHTKTFEGYKVSLATHGALKSGVENILMFSLSENSKSFGAAQDKPITDLQEYLGALGHSVILREGTLDFIHAHPLATPGQNGVVSFMVNFPESGKHKIFTQFQRNGKVFTTNFTVSVEQGASSGGAMPGMNHSIHQN